MKEKIIIAINIIIFGGYNYYNTCKENDKYNNERKIIIEKMRNYNKENLILVKLK
jgi:hypothetical protein